MADELKARIAALEAERTGTIHESWQHKTHAEVLDGLKFQGAITKSLLTHMAEVTAEHDEATAELTRQKLDICDQRDALTARLAEAERRLMAGLLVANNSVIGQHWKRTTEEFLRPADSAPAAPRCKHNVVQVEGYECIYCLQEAGFTGQPPVSAVDGPCDHAICDPRGEPGNMEIYCRDCGVVMRAAVTVTGDRETDNHG